MLVEGMRVAALALLLAGCVVREESQLNRRDPYCNVLLDDCLRRIPIDTSTAPTPRYYPGRRIFWDCEDGRGASTTGGSPGCRKAWTATAVEGKSRLEQETSFCKCEWARCNLPLTGDCNDARRP